MLVVSHKTAQNAFHPVSVMLLSVKYTSLSLRLLFRLVARIAAPSSPILVRLRFNDSRRHAGLANDSAITLGPSRNNGLFHRLSSGNLNNGSCRARAISFSLKSRSSTLAGRPWMSLSNPLSPILLKGKLKNCECTGVLCRHCMLLLSTY